MADYAITMDFLQQLRRMCSRCRRSLYDCDACPLRTGNNGTSLSCMQYLMALPAEAIKAVQGWADDNAGQEDAAPARSWVQKLRDVLPDAQIRAIVPVMCPRTFFRGAPNSGDDRCNDGRDCAACWGWPDE